MTVLTDGDDDPVVPAGDAGRVPLPAHQNKGLQTTILPQCKKNNK